MAAAVVGACVSWGADAAFEIRGTAPWPVTSALEYAREIESCKLPPDEDFAGIESDALMLGLVSDTYWFRLRLHNATAERTFTLGIENPRLGLAEMWTDTDEGLACVARVGDTVAPTQGALGRRPAAFQVSIEPGETTTAYVRITHHGSLQIRARLWTEHSFLRFRALENVVDGALCGAIGIMFVYNVLVLLRVRRLSYAYFTSFILFFLLYVLALRGLGNEYAWRGQDWFAVRGIVFFYALVSLFLHAFSRSYLGTRHRAPAWDKCLVAGMIVSVVVALGSFTYSLGISYLAHVLAILTPFYIIGASVTCWFSGYRPAGIFLVAWSILLACAIHLAMASLGWIEHRWYLERSALGGFVVALAIFSMAMGERARMSAQQFQAGLEQQVSRRTSELQEALENVRTLSRMVPICSHCKKIRDDAGYWNQVEAYLQRLGDVNLTHGVCPDCADKHYPEFSKRS